MNGQVNTGAGHLITEIRETAMALKMALTEIHPVVEQNGMTAVSELIGRMKREVDEISTRSSVVGIMSSGMGADLDSLALAMSSRLALVDPSRMNDIQLQEAMLAAECFAGRSREMLSMRRAYHDMVGVADVAELAG